MITAFTPGPAQTDPDLIARAKRAAARLNTELNANAEAISAVLAEPGRQFCRTGAHPCIPAVTLTFDGGARRLHWCTDHTADAEQYRADSDQADVIVSDAGWRKAAESGQ